MGQERLIVKSCSNFAILTSCTMGAKVFVSFNNLIFLTPQYVSIEYSNIQGYKEDQSRSSTGKGLERIQHGTTKVKIHKGRATR